MRGFVLGLSLSIAFIAGALFESTRSTADAQRGRREWEYRCVQTSNWTIGNRSNNFAALVNAGHAGWEYIDTFGGGRFTCFKRPE